MAALQWAWLRMQGVQGKLRSGESFHENQQCRGLKNSFSSREKP